MDLYKCDVCEMTFRDIGKLSGRKRIFHHKMTDHKASCGNCGKQFVSNTHVAVHKYQNHDVICIRCNTACEGNCMEKVTNEIEQAGGKMMEIELRKIETQITDSEEAILHQFSDATELQMGVLQEMAWFIDNGHTGCSANNWGMLTYFPSVDINIFGLSDFGREYIQKHVYLSALKKLELYLNKMCKNGVPEQINEYTKFCIRLYSENALFDISPEKLIGAKFCLPE